MDTLEITKFVILAVFAIAGVYLAIKSDNHKHSTH